MRIDERAAFEDWAETVGLNHLERGFGELDDYGFVETRRMWAAWQARADMAKLQKVYLEQQLRALLATGGQAQANSVIDFPHEEVDALAITRYKVVAADKSMFWESAVVAGDGTRQLYTGRKVECENMARKFAGAFAEGAFVFHAMHAPQAQADAKEPTE